MFIKKEEKEACSTREDAEANYEYAGGYVLLDTSNNIVTSHPEQMPLASHLPITKGVRF
jgi:hypothetical protein